MTAPRKLVSAAPAREHLEVLRQTMRWQDVSTTTGCGRETLHHIYRQRCTKIRPGTESRILAVEPWQTKPLTFAVDSTGTVRRLRALAAIGHTSSAIAAASGCSPKALPTITKQRRHRVRVAMAIKIKAAYEELSISPASPTPASERTRTIASQHGWQPPHAWQGLDIDDPDITPHTAPDAAPETATGTPLGSSKPRAAGGRWQHYAACRDQDPELFFPIGSAGPALTRTAEAKSVCAACGVKRMCLQWALDSGQDFGVWGGTSEDERGAMKARTA